MVVQHNLTAQNSNRMLGITTKSQASSTEKLSSGYKINRAADDAAGLSISEKMRRQIRGLTQASANAQDGISSVQTAEGALTEVHDMLQRMDELATKAANGTMSEDDRQNVQDEISQLTTEIDRVSETTKFNEIYLLKGNTADTKSDRLVSAKDAGLNGKLTNVESGVTKLTTEKLNAGDMVKIGGTEYNIVNSARSSDYSTVHEYTTPSAGDKIEVDGKTYTYVKQTSLTPAGQKAGTDGWYEANNKTTVADETSAAPSNLVKAGAKLTKYVQATSTSQAGFKTTILVGNSTNAIDSTSTKGAIGWKAGDTITDASGTTYTYYAASTNAKAGTDSGFYLNRADAENKEVGAYQPHIGDNYKIALTGKESQIANHGIQSLQDVRDKVLNAAADTQVTIYRDAKDTTGKTYTIGVPSDISATKYGNKEIADMLKEDSYVKIGSSDQYYILPGSSNKPTDITVNQAYTKMAEELTKANNIGTDSDKQASVVNNGDGSFTINQGKVTVKDALTFSLHVGADADMTNKIGVSIDAMDSAGLGIKGINVKDATGASATYAIDSIEKAIKTVSTQRSALGAVQNRLEHTIKNLDNVVENTTSAESAIRDTDMATEMVTFSKNNILKQAGQSMLAQANQSNQGVLSLLQ